MDQIAFLIPSTSKNRNWTDIKESYLYHTLSILNKNYKNITVYIGYDTDDIFYINHISELNEYFDLTIKYISSGHFEKGNVVGWWNHLTKLAISDGFEYFFIIGDDINYPDNNEWLKTMIDGLKKNNNIGYSAGDSGNPYLPMTQFLIHKKHYEIFSYVFNPMLKNWYCDNYLNELYPKRFINYYKDIQLHNCGGEPRYIPEDHKKLYKMLVKRDRKKLKL
tara:strand:+ start:95 stop:757 length:663 start_codon:yes stop_codon:yes gene_type:complete